MSEMTLDCRVDREACPLNMAPTASTTATLALGDALAVALMVRRGFKREDFLRSHPAGSLGERLRLKVSDMMLESFAVPRVSPDSRITEIVESINGKNLGLTMVTSGDTLLGIITDGDLRRALANGSNLFNEEAQNLMTKKPLSIRANRTAAEALEIMETKLITALSVVDHKGKCLGIIHLHDLLGKGQVPFAF
jgi:arabinose-5-phosphate isomerase